MTRVESFNLFGTSIDGVSGVLTIDLDAPEKVKNGYVCTVSIKGIGETQVTPITGADPIHALIIAIHLIYQAVDFHEHEGWKFFLSTEYDENSRYSSEVWHSSIRKLF